MENYSNPMRPARHFKYFVVFLFVVFDLQREGRNAV